MGSLLSLFQSNIYLNNNINSISEQAKKNIEIIFELLEKEPKNYQQNIEQLISSLPKNSCVLQVYNKKGFNLIQEIIGKGNIYLLKYLLANRNIDLNKGVCSLPLHIACLNGFEDCVEVLLKHGARSDVEARMCFPGLHNQNCEHRSDMTSTDRASEKLQNAIYYAIDGDNVDILELLMQDNQDSWLPWQTKKPLLNIACEKGAWECVKYLVVERSDEINQCHDEYYPIHHCSLLENKFMELLLENGAEIKVKTATQQMTVLHVMFLLGKKSAENTLEAVKIALNAGLKDLINTPDSLGNTPLHALIVRYALEEARYGYNQDQSQPWGKYEMLLIARYLLQNGAAPSINQPGNSALACVLRQVRDWEFRYELLDMLLAAGGDPNQVGRDGSVPLMVCLVPLINKDPLHHFTHSMKVFYLNCVKLLCRYGGNPNCLPSRSNLTPLHVLMFSASENTALTRDKEKEAAFTFIRQLLVILLQHGLDPNVRFSQRTQHILLSLMDMVSNARCPGDLQYVCDLTLTLLTHGADPNTPISTTEPMICHSQSSVFLKKCSNQVLYYYVQLLIRREELLVGNNYVKLLNIYYCAMNHKELYQCLKILHTQVALVPTAQPLVDILRDMYTKPRSLKQLARVSVYSALNRRTQERVSKLPIPPLIKEYILSFEP